MAAKIRKGDKVVVLTGRDKGRTGEVFEVRPDAGTALVRGINLLTEVFHARQHRIEGTEVGAGVGRDDPSQRGFADAWWSMQDQIADTVGFDRPPEQATIGQDSALTLEFLQAPRSHPIRQRRVAAAHLLALVGKEILAQGSRGGTGGKNTWCDPDRSFFSGVIALLLQSPPQRSFQTS